jgi:hypothetical protein
MMRPIRKTRQCAHHGLWFFLVAAHFAGQVGFLTVRKFLLGEAPVKVAAIELALFSCRQKKARHIFLFTEASQ